MRFMPESPPCAVIESRGRWTYLVFIAHDLSTYGPDGYGWIVIGHKRAQRKARRELKKYMDRYYSERSREIIEPTE